jgi:hypothetical protein
VRVRPGIAMLSWKVRSSPAVSPSPTPPFRTEANQRSGMTAACRAAAPSKGPRLTPKCPPRATHRFGQIIGSGNVPC